MQDTKRFKTQHPAAGPGWSGALGSLCGGEEEEQEGSEGLLEASHASKGAGTDKTKCGWLKVPVEDCIATTGAMTGKGCDGMGGGGIGDG